MIDLSQTNDSKRIHIVDMAEQLRHGGYFDVEHWRPAKSGKLRLLGISREKNLVVNQGLQYALGVALAATAKVPSWFVGIFETSYTILATDDLTAVLGATTECIAYNEPSRPAWNGVLGSLTITNNAARAEFTMNATKTIFGAWLASVATKSVGGGTLWAGAEFSTSKDVDPADVLRVRYDCNVAAA